MMNGSLEKALKETWEMKEKFYKDTKGLSMIEILEKIEGKKFNLKKKRKKIHFPAFNLEVQHHRSTLGIAYSYRFVKGPHGNKSTGIPGPCKH